MWKVLNKEVDLGEPTSFLDHVYLGCTQRQCEISKDVVDNYRTMFESRISAGATEKLPCSENIRISAWSYEVEVHAKKCVERYCELANRTTQQLYKVSTPCIDDHYFKEELKSVGESSKECSQIVLKCLYLALIGRPDIMWSVNKLARAVTKWTKACYKRLSRLITHIHPTCDHKQYCHVGNTAKQCRLGLFQDSDFAGVLEDSKNRRRRIEILYLSRIGRPDIPWSVKKLARSTTKWTKACDRRLYCLISYIHHTCEHEQYCYVGNTAKQCRLGLFQDSDFAKDLEDSKSTLGGTLCVFGSHTFVPTTWMCKKQTSVSHISTESEIISLDAGLRLDGIPALDLWDLIVAVLYGNTYQNDQVRRDPSKSPTRKKIHGMIDDLDNVDFISSNVNSSRKEALLQKNL